MRGTHSHQCRRAHKCPPYSLTHRPKVDLLQALITTVYKRGSEGRVVGLHHQIAPEAPGARGPIGAVGQLKVRIADVQSVVWIKGDGWDLKILVPETGGVEGLLEVKGKKHNNFSATGEMRVLKKISRLRSETTHRSGQEGMVALSADGEIAVAAL